MEIREKQRKLVGQNSAAATGDERSFRWRGPIERRR